MVKNIISLPGVSNARELGGYPVSGGFVKNGVLIRCGALPKAKPEAIRDLKEKYHLQTIVDLRMSDKRAGEPDAEIEGAENIHLPVIEMMDYFTMSGKTDMAQKFRKGNLDKMAVLEMAFEYGMLGPEIYVGFLLGQRGKKAYRGFFDILLKTDPEKGAVLWHCDDGKDRAGLATMLLLTVLGADRETIMEDYLLTNECNAHVIAAVRKEFEGIPMSEEKLNAMIFASGGVFANYMENAIDVLEKRYGSVEDYIRKDLGLTDEDFDVLRKKFTQQTQANG